MTLSAKEFETIVQRQTGIAKKVFDAVPLQDMWNSGQVASELARLGPRVEKNMIEGCLDTLVQSGIVIEPKRGLFQRAKVKADKPCQTCEPVVAEVLVKPASNTPAMTAFDTLTDMASRARGMAVYLGVMADELEAVALTMLQEKDETSTELAKLRQLQSLLRDLKG